MDDNQTLIPAAFVALYQPHGGGKPTLPAAELAARHEHCDDLAQTLTTHATTTQDRLDLSGGEVLVRTLVALRDPSTQLSDLEALWVVCRLGELLGWPVPPNLADPLPEPCRAWLAQQQRGGR